MDVINLSDSDEDAHKEAAIETEKPQPETVASPVKTASPVNRPGPLSVKMKRMQLAGEKLPEQDLLQTDILPKEDYGKNKHTKKNKIPMAETKLLFDDPTSKFLADFNPETSFRERRKLTRKTYTESKIGSKSVCSTYDEKGMHRETALDICDCLDLQCPGCHFGCPSCRSTKCGAVCRCNRKWMYETVEYDGKDDIVKNRLLFRA